MFHTCRPPPRADGNATLVLATPMGMSLLPYHRVLMAPYSVRQLVTLDEVGQRGGEGQRAVGWSAEGYHVHCFERVRGWCISHGCMRSCLDVGPISQGPFYLGLPGALQLGISSHTILM